MKKRIAFASCLFLMMVLSLFIGRYGTHVQDILLALCGQGDAIVLRLLWNIRIPRILLVSLCGGALALSGVVYQTIFKNPLASGDVIGASSGCSLGAVFAILCFQSTWVVEGFAFLGGLFSVGCTMVLAQRAKGNRILNLVIAGLILQAVTTSLMMVLKICADPQRQLASIEYWLMGGFSDSGWNQVSITFLFVLICSILLYCLRWQIQMLGFGEEAETLGVAVKKIRFCALFLSTLLISCVISVAGIVSWVGLLVPHIIRLLTKQPISKNMGLTFLCGSLFLLLCDTLARSLFVVELPISILTSFFGAICLIVLFVKGRLPL